MRRPSTARTECLVKEYSSFELPGGIHMNGKLTLGENTADNGGLRLAWMALMNDLAGKTLPQKDGYTEQQRFFPRLGSDLVRQRNARDAAAAGADRSARHRRIPRERRGFEYARISEGLQLQGRAADGARGEFVPSLVAT